MSGASAPKSITYERYYDKVYGAWLGKSIAGTIGAPFEGRKELFEYRFDPKAIEQMLPNDDLELQVLWLEVLEKKGIYLESSDLAEAFYSKCPYAPGEYAYFMKNYARGIFPPLSGSFNNRYYINGMGCPIRSEIWACISPGNPALAAEYAAKDGVMDHEGDPVYAEQFLAAVESAAFFENDLNRLFDIGMAYLPAGTKIRRLVEDTRRWAEEEPRWEKVRSWIIRDYGHPDCTNLYQNIGFTLLALIHGDENFLDTTMIALNCGFDTDCTCATAGALLGILYGASYLIETHNFYDTTYAMAIDVRRPTNKLEDLAADTCRVGLTLAIEMNRHVLIQGAPQFTPVPTFKKENDVRIQVKFDGDPVIGWAESKAVAIRIENRRKNDLTGRLLLEIPEGWVVTPAFHSIDIAASHEGNFSFTVHVPREIRFLSETNIVSARLSGGNCEETFRFGLNGAQVWKVHGPYWENALILPQLELGEWYSSYIKADHEDTKMDILRQYHLNTFVDLDKDYWSTRDSQDYLIANIKEDRFAVNDLIGFEGPCIVYAERTIYSPEDREVHLLIGHSDAYELWLNGRMISRDDRVDWWTAENRHHSQVRLKKGENRLLLKCVRRSQRAEFSVIFSEKGVCMPHVYDLGSIIDETALDPDRVPSEGGDGYGEGNVASGNVAKP